MVYHHFFLQTNCVSLMRFFYWMVFVLTNLQAVWIHAKCFFLPSNITFFASKMVYSPCKNVLMLPSKHDFFHHTQMRIPPKGEPSLEGQEKNQIAAWIGWNWQQLKWNPWTSLNIKLISSNAQNYIFYHMVGNCWETPSSCLDPNLRGNMDTPS